MRIELALRTATASLSTRTIEGVATVYGVRAHASHPIVIEAGGIEIPAELGRSKLVIDHDTSQPVGYLVAADDTAERLVGRWYVPEGAAGDAALQQAANGLRDGLSVGLDLADDGYTFDEDGYLHVTRAAWRETTLCAVPAYDDARVSEVVASLRNTTPRGTAPMTTTPEATPTVAAELVPVAPAAPPAVVATSAAPVQLAAPAISVVERGSVMTLRAAAELISSVYQRGGGASDVRSMLGITAALADVVPADDAGLGFGQPDFVGELWRASQARRPFIDLLGTPKPLRSRKVTGWKWDVEPQVVEYLGNKTEVTGNDVSTVPAEGTAKRLAGGWDVDRIFVDLGDAGMIEALFEAATEDYRRKTEASVVAELLAGASSVAGQTSLAGALVALGSAAASLGAEISGVGFGSTVWAQFTALTRDEVPWWLGAGDSISIGTVSGTVGGIKLFSSPGLGATQIMGADSRAATFYEVDPPVRVQALDVANGGIDLGVFGYHALIINDARALIKTTVVPVP